MRARDVRRLGRLARRARELEHDAHELARELGDFYAASAAELEARRAGDVRVAAAVAQLRGRWMRQSLAADKRGDVDGARRFRGLAQQLDALLLAARRQRAADKKSTNEALTLSDVRAGR